MYQLPLYAGILDFMATFAKKALFPAENIRMNIATKYGIFKFF